MNTEKTTRLLIVDDEPTTIKRIFSRIDFDSLGIGDIRTAENGQEALSVCSDWRPDILLSDIMMPRMTGIELAEELKKAYPDLRIIFLSGYMEKEFLKGAIHLQALNYIEKPLDMDELYETLRNAQDQLLASEDISLRLEKLDDEHLTTQLRLLAYELCAENYREELVTQYYSEVFAGKEAMPCVALQLKFYVPEQKEFNSLVELLPQFRKVAASLGLTACAVVKYDYIVGFLFDETGETGNDKVYFVSAFLRELRKELVLLNKKYTAGAGHVCPDFTELHESFLEAEEANRLAFFHGPGYHSYYRKNIKKFDFESCEALEAIRSLKKNGRDQTVFKLREFNTALESCEGTDPEDVKRFYSSLVLELSRLAREDGIRLFAEYPGDHDLLIVVMEQNFLIELFDFLMMGIETYCNVLSRDYYPNQTVNWIIRYIHEHYSDQDLDMTMLSNASNLSSTYISHLFKNTTGKTVRNYITEYRMKQAVRLLKDPTNQINDIATACGYRNGNYFSFRFKECYGCTPTEYIEQGEGKAEGTI
ncbi:MAG: response regulator [Lachnospiraceae bacterium]|nr:response regulator [Lachnospiraceae bacterium]